jgi:hypothetical protein
MMQLGRQACWWPAMQSGVCAAMILTAACGGSESTRTPAATEPQAPAASVERAAKVTEKPFASGGKIEMQLDGGSYTVRPGDGNVIRLALSGNVGATKADVTTSDAQATVSVKETPHNNFQATIDVPRSAHLVIRLAAGDLKVEAIGGDKDIESTAGNVDIVTGDSKDYASVDATVHAGDLNAGAFGESQSGLFRSLTWSGTGKYTLRAKLTAGNLTLRDK